MNTLVLTRDFEQAEMGLDLGLQSSRHHRSKALDEIYKMARGSNLGHCVEAAKASDSCYEKVNLRGSEDVVIFRFFEKRSRPLQNV